MAHHVQTAWLAQRPGWQVFVDNHGPKWHGEQGNMLIQEPGTLARPQLAFSAHLDTVGPCREVKPKLAADRITSDGTSILGADDKCAVVAILAAVAALEDARVPHGPLEIWFSMAEECGLCGARYFELDRAQARRCIVLDASKPVGTIIGSAPFADKMTITVHGRAAHAGIEPEKGVNALVVAAEAIQGMKLGRIDAETTANLGIAQGGIAQNIVMAELVIAAEARSLDKRKLDAQVAHMRERFAEAAAHHRVSNTFDVEEEYYGYQFDADEPLVQLVSTAATALGLAPTLEPAGGGSDANIYNTRGITAINCGCGMAAVHTKQEYILTDELARLADLVAAIVVTDGAAAD